MFQELFVLQLALMLRRQKSSLNRRPRLPATAKIDARIRRLFPFETDGGPDQRIAGNRGGHGSPDADESLCCKATWAAARPWSPSTPMLLAVRARHQAVIMAPTEVLARQHLRTLHAGPRATAGCGSACSPVR